MVKGGWGKRAVYPFILGVKWIWWGGDKWGNRRYDEGIEGVLGGSYDILKPIFYRTEFAGCYIKNF